ncbi:MAG: SPFH/Band 7/PHB domain protein [Rhodobacteraceae bacterium]|nr:SPFH/Band 7/PHB domain protein [Paracoccaceae bacterium]
MPAPLIIAAVVAILAVFLIYKAVVIVPQGENWTLEAFGRYIGTLDPGIHFLIPFYQDIGAKLNMMESVLDIPSQDVITRDNAQVTADAVSFYQIINAADAAYQVRDLERAMVNLTMTNIRTVLGSLDLDEVLSNRDDINARLLTVIDKATNPWGVKVTRVEIKDLTPPADITEAMARQMKAERVKRAEILQAEGDKQSAILRAEGQKQGQVLEAEGRREAAFRDAEARERSAEAEAKATTMVSTAIAEGDVQAVNYFVAQKYVEALRDIAAADNQKVIMMPLEASSVIGSIAGLSELSKAAAEKARS